jgi:hypothetical protein
VVSPCPPPGGPISTIYSGKSLPPPGCWFGCSFGSPNLLALTVYTGRSSIQWKDVDRISAVTTSHSKAKKWHKDIKPILRSLERSILLKLRLQVHTRGGWFWFIGRMRHRMVFHKIVVQAMSSSINARRIMYTLPLARDKSWALTLWYRRVANTIINGQILYNRDARNSSFSYAGL